MKIYKSLILLLCILLAACASPRHIPLYTQAIADAPDEPRLSVQYLGVGGHILRYSNTTLLTAPSLSNPHLLRLGPLMPIGTDKARVDRYLPDVSDAEMILVGHAHYDHLMDVPYIMEKHAPEAHVYGSLTMKHAIQPAVSEQRIHALNELMGTADTPGSWIYSRSGRIRIMPLRSAHAPHFMGITLMQGQYSAARQTLPWHAFGWKEGQTMAYLIDFLSADSRQPVFRIFYQDSASQAPAGLVPPLGDGKSIDIAILCAASFAQIKNYPESVMHNTQAGHFIIGHWEDFFANDLSKPQRFVRAIDQDEFMRRFRLALPHNSSWALPGLFSVQYFNHQGFIAQ